MAEQRGLSANDVALPQAGYIPPTLLWEVKSPDNTAWFCNDSSTAILCLLGILGFFLSILFTLFLSRSISINYIL